MKIICTLAVRFLVTPVPLHQQVEAVGLVNPLLDQSVHYRDSELMMPGNTTLTSLNLAGQ